MKNIFLILFILGMSKVSFAQTYLPLAGGTLTGALFGKTARFSDFKISDGSLMLGSASGGSMIPILAGVSESPAYGMYYNINKATNQSPITGYSVAAHYFGTVFSATSGNLLRIDNNQNAKFIVNYAGNVGIGTASPAFPLVVQQALGSDVISINDGEGVGRLSLGQELLYTGNYIDSKNIDLKIKTYRASGTGGNIIFMTQGNGSSAVTERMRIDQLGNISIGSTDSRGYKFAVNGSMIAESVNVKLYSAWPDYVFNKGYTLKPLMEVEHYIKTNRHLPGIPDASEVAKEGLNLGEMNAKLLQKIEELTLYIIEQNKRIEKLENKQ